MKSTHRSRWLHPYDDFGAEGQHAVDGGQVVAMFAVVLLVCGIVAAGRRVIGAVSAISGK